MFFLYLRVVSAKTLYLLKLHSHNLSNRVLGYYLYSQVQLLILVRQQKYKKKKAG